MNSMDINTELIKRAQQGDVTVLAELYERYHLSVFRYLYYRVGDRETAEDLTSEVFERMLRFVGGFQPPSSSFQAWLFQIARNLSTDHFRKMSVRSDVELEEELLHQHTHSEGSIDRALTIAELRNAMSQLTEDQREVLVMRFVAGMPIAEVARVLDRSEDAIKGLQRRGLTALRQILTEWEIYYA